MTPRGVLTTAPGGREEGVDMRKALLAAVAALALGGAYACGNTCQDGCDKTEECFGAENVTETCVEDCETALEGDDAETQQKCLDCVVDTECDAITNGDCASDCGG